MKDFGIYFILSILFALGGKQAHAQYIPTDLSEKAHVSILTVGPAEPLYTMFGHTAIRLQDPRRGIDVVYNYGTFDFESDGFYWKFARGNLHYFLSKTDFITFKRENVQLGRSIWGQVLNLESQKVREIVRQLEMELLPENRYYKYEFFANNCVTKVRGVLVKQDVLDPSQFGNVQDNDPSYRQLLSPYLELRPWMALGINLLLGASADETINGWEQQFLPNQLSQSLASTHVRFTDEPILVKTQNIAESSSPLQTAGWVTPLLLFWILFAVVTTVTIYDLIHKIIRPWIDRLLFGVAGLLGLLLLLFAIGSQHHPLRYNWNLLWAAPTHLIIAAGMYRLKNRTWFRHYLWIAWLSGIGFLAGWYWLPQEFPLAVLPLVLTLVVRLGSWLFGDDIRMLVKSDNDIDISKEELKEWSILLGMPTG